MSRTPMFMMSNHVVAGVYPVADIYNGNAVTDIICMKNYDVATFFLIHGVSTGGASDSTITVDAIDNAGGTTAVAMPFKYWHCVSGVTVDAWTGPVLSAATGWDMTGASNQMYAVEVTGAEVMAAGRGDTPAFHADWVRLTATEAGNDHPIVGTIFCVLSNARYADASMPTAIV